MGHVEAARLRQMLPDGRVLYDDVSFRVGDGSTVALVGANGSGKTTLLRTAAGDLDPTSGAVSSSGGVGVMRQFIGSIRDASTVRDLLVSVAPTAVRDAAHELDAAELAMLDTDDEPTQLRYASALAAYADAGGYDTEVRWDTCCTSALGKPFEQVRWREIRTLSGGEQKRLALEALLRGPDQVLLLDEPDNYLDVPAKEWLEDVLRATKQTVLFVSHDRELLARTADRIVTVEGGTAWVHGGGFGTYDDARQARHDRMDEVRRRWDEEHARLKQLVATMKQKASYNSDMASRYQAALTRLRRFEAGGPPQKRPPAQRIRMRLAGGRTGVRAVVCEGLALTGLTSPFDTEVRYGERVAVLGANGTGKSHFLRLLAGWADIDGTARPDAVAHTGAWKLGARVVPGHFAQTHERPDLVGRTPAEVLWRDHSLQLHDAMHALARYGLAPSGEQPFDTLSGGQQARLQILLLELSGSTLLLLDEPTDNLDLESADALEQGLAEYQGTVLAVTHDRWFAKGFDRYLVFGGDGTVRETPEPIWEPGG
ncbi:MAG: ATP-binding cassette domain-containing protein [Streptosporangiales bacterium]|nr:ATP-binding cassette domain-containing protein [Streptosporangiales bacterium]